ANDVAPARAQGAAGADFFSTRSNVGEHDVHDAHAADDQRNAGDDHHDDRPDALGGDFLAHQLDGDEQLVVFELVSLAQIIFHALRGGDDQIRIFHLNRDGIELNSHLLVGADALAEG